MAKRGTIGIDIGGTKILLGLFDDHFRARGEIRLKTRADKGEKNFTRNLTEALEALLRKARKQRLDLAAVGVGCTGDVNEAEGTLQKCPNIPFLVGYPLQKRIARLTGLNVLLLNDVQAGVYGEHRLGAAQAARHVIGVFIGTGIGGALIVDGKLYLGAHGHAGDIGHFMLQPMGPLSGSPRRGVLDDVASRTAIAGAAATLAAKQWAPHLLKEAGTDVVEIRSKHLASAITGGDKAVEELVRSRARTVGIALANFVDFLNPDMIVLGGGLVDALPQLIRHEVEKGIRETATAEAQAGLKVAVSKLNRHAITAGAAKFALDRFRLPDG